MKKLFFTGKKAKVWVVLLSQSLTPCVCEYAVGKDPGLQDLSLVTFCPSDNGVYLFSTR